MAKEKIDYSDILVNEIDVQIGSDKYVLREASGDAARRFRNAQIACYKYDDKGVLKSVEGIADLEPLLVSLCLFKVVDGKEEPVTEEFVRGLTARRSKDLFRRVKAISDLAEDSLNERDGLAQALAREGSPVTLAALQDYMKSLEGEEWDAIKNWIKPTAGEAAKNLQSGTTAGSA